MNRSDSRMKRQWLSVRGILFYAVGGLFLLTMLSFWMVFGMYAKYTVSGSIWDSARVAAGLSLEVKEHEAVLEDGQYKLNNTKEVEGNTYKKVIPGVDIPKDPFIRLTGTSEVDYWLYVEISEKDFPKNANGKATVTYEVTDDWEPVANQPNVYKYKYILDSGSYNGKVIDNILKKNIHGYELTVSQYYEGKKQDFSLTFRVWLVQAD